MTKDEKPKAWENGVSFFSDVISRELREEIVRASVNEAPRWKRYVGLKEAIEENFDKLVDAIEISARRYVAMRKFESRPIFSEIEGRLKALKKIEPKEMRAAAVSMMEDDATAMILREAAYDLGFSEAPEDLLDRPSRGSKLVARAIEINQDHQNRHAKPGPKENVGLRTFLFELAAAWEATTGKKAGSGGVVMKDYGMNGKRAGSGDEAKKDQAKNRKKAGDGETKETRQGPFLNFATEVYLALPDSWDGVPKELPAYENPEVRFKKTLVSMSKRRKEAKAFLEDLQKQIDRADADHKATEASKSKAL
jgi:hypothetical protein